LNRALDRAILTSQLNHRRRNGGKEALVSVFMKAALCTALGAPIAVATRGARVERPQAAASRATRADSVNWKAVDSAVGRASVVQPGDVHRFNFPRGDLRVTAAGVDVKPALALGGWVAMKAITGGVIAMGDLVLTEDEINPVMIKLQHGGIEQTAIHHHLLHESPRVYYMHVHGQGDPLKLARTLRDAIAVTKVPPPTPAAPASAVDLDTSAVAKALGYSGRVNGGVYQVGVPRAEPITEHGMEIPPSMGLATAINFQPTGGGKAAITGDFVLTAGEVNPVIRALTSHGIEVTSIHSHLLDESPRLFFMHFWANDDAAKLAAGLRAALDVTKSQKPTSR
jgi:Domain of Unknown Function (DUF1259)